MEMVLRSVAADQPQPTAPSVESRSVPPAEQNVAGNHSAITAMTSILRLALKSLPKSIAQHVAMRTPHESPISHGGRSFIK
jgi:hypothetical protein